jgi:hypothetical protein
MPATPAWVADPHVTWNILLIARLVTPPTAETVAERLDAVASSQGWNHSRTRVERSLPEAVDRLARHPLDGPVEAVVVEDSIVIAAHHSVVDGLGLLALLEAATGLAVTSSARGLGERGDRTSLGRAAVKRLGEVAFRPPAAVGQSGAEGAATIATLDVPGSIGTARLVHAAAYGVAAYNTGQGHHPRRALAVAVGASRVGGTPLRIGEFSALLRLADVRGLSADEIQRLLREAPTEPSPTGSGETFTSRAVGLGVRLLRRRLGSTLLVSHLGEVTAPGVVEMAFLPVTGGGSGVALGAVTLAGHTSLALRDSSGRNSPDALQEILQGVREELAR